MARFWNTREAPWNTPRSRRYHGKGMLDDLDLFLCLAAHGTLNRAAKQLRLPKSICGTANRPIVPPVRPTQRCARISTCTPAYVR